MTPYEMGSHDKTGCDGMLHPYPTFDRIHCDRCDLTIIREWPHRTGAIHWVVDSFVIQEWPS